jgi:hypothetical protein
VPPSRLVAPIAAAAYHPQGHEACDPRRRAKFTWRHPAGLLKRAAEAQQDVAEVLTALREARSREALPSGIGRRPAATRCLPRYSGSKIEELNLVCGSRGEPPSRRDLRCVR